MIKGSKIDSEVLDVATVVVAIVHKEKFYAYAHVGHAFHPEPCMIRYDCEYLLVSVDALKEEGTHKRYPKGSYAIRFGDGNTLVSATFGWRNADAGSTLARAPRLEYSCG